MTPIFALPPYAGICRLVLFTGEPGIGKTRLAQEAAVLAAEHGFIVASSRCYQPTSATP